jgi:hypothetical protein
VGELVGRLITGTLWGLGAGLAMTFGKEGGTGIRTAAKAAMKGYIAAAAKVGEARESMDDLIAESRSSERAPTETRAAPRSIPVERDRPVGQSPNGGTHDGTRKSASRPRATKRA